MQDLIDFVQANSALGWTILSNHRRSAARPSRSGNAHDLGRSASTQNMRTTADGDSRSRVPSCGRRYADAPTAVLFTARGGGEFPPSSARQCRCCGRAQDCGLYAVLP
jgi:hypothetical protein